MNPVRFAVQTAGAEVPDFMLLVIRAHPEVRLPDHLEGELVGLQVGYGLARPPELDYFQDGLRIRGMTFGGQPFPVFLPWASIHGILLPDWAIYFQRRNQSKVDPPKATNGPGLRVVK